MAQDANNDPFSFLIRNQTVFETKLYDDHNSTDDQRTELNKTVFKYPSDLGQSPDLMSIMLIEMYESTGQQLKTRRNTTEQLATTLFDSGKKKLMEMFPNKFPKNKSDTTPVLRFNASSSPEEQRAYFEQQRRLNQADPESPHPDKIGVISGAVLEVGTALGGAAAGAIGVFADSFINRTKGVLNPKGGNIDIGLGETRDSWTEEATGLHNSTTKMPQKIYLYMPTGLDVNYGMEYENSSMAGLDSLKLTSAILQGDNATARDIAKKIALNNLKLLDSSLIGDLAGIESGTFNKFMAADQKQIVNPMALHLFKDVTRRGFVFSYTFLPRSYEEMQTCLQIIGLLKYYAHPKRSEGTGRFLDYPAEFDITFLVGEKVNKYLPKILKCSLEGIKVKYGEETSFSTFQTDAYGAAPTKITMELSFSELEILTRDRITWKAATHQSS